MSPERWVATSNLKQANNISKVSIWFDLRTRTKRNFVLNLIATVTFHLKFQK